MISLKELCDRLGISVTTGRNWLKLKKLTPTVWEHGKPYFSRQAAEEIEQSLKDGSLDQLRSRRNKSRRNGIDRYRSYLSEKGKSQEVLSLLFVRFSEEWLASHSGWVLRQYAGQLLKERGLSLHLLEELPQSISLPSLPECFPESLCSSNLPENCSKRMNATYTVMSEDVDLPLVPYVPYEDFLGALYLSLCALSGRKEAGAYYTPAGVGRLLVKSLPSADRYLDPCCGTGSFLLLLAEEGKALSQLFGQDLDPVAAAICRINLALTFGIEDVDLLHRQIRQGDSLRDFPLGPWPAIIGNPPWGIPISEEIRKELRADCQTAVNRRPESCSLILELALRELTEGGCLAMVVPEALLHVQRHQDIREVLLSQSSPLQVEYIGDVFGGVMCPAVLLTLRRSICGFDLCGTRVRTSEKSFTIQRSRETEDAFLFSVDDSEYTVLRQMDQLPGKLFLKDSIFALGIVTGDNKRLLTDHPGEGLEGVLRGRDIHPGIIDPPSSFLLFQPEQFQQMACEEFYRTKEKLVYSFISDRLCFAIDREGRLTLNSCNIVIPRVEGLSLEYILELLNSRLLNFYWKKKFHSTKVLRQHLEQLPLAPASREEQEAIIRLAIDHSGQVEERIAKLYGFSAMPEEIFEKND